jgi:hypothetical protein
MDALKCKWDGNPAIAKAIAEGVIDPDYHERILESMEDVLLEAGITRDALLNSALNYYATPELISWLKSDSKGLVITGDFPHLEKSMMALGAVYIRNYISSKVYIVEELVRDAKEGTYHSSSYKMILVPNFCLSKKDSGTLPSWQSGLLLGVLTKRLTQDKRTVLYVSSMEALKELYGMAFYKHVSEHYVIL